MNHNLRVLKQYLRVRIIELTEFRLDFLLRVLLEIAYVVIAFIFSKVLTGSANIGINATDLFIYSQILDLTWDSCKLFKFNLASIIRTGSLTKKLIRPINIILDLVANSFGLITHLTVLLKLIFIIILGYVYDVNLIIISTILIISLTIGLLYMIFYNFFIGSLELIKPGLSDIFNEIVNSDYFSKQIKRYPSNLFPKFFTVYMGIFPIYYLSILIINTIKMTNLYLFFIIIPIQILLLIIMILLSNYTWNKYLKNYEAEGG